MKFVISSTELLSHLSSISRVITNKTTVPILDHFLFNLEEGKLTITATDTETTLTTWIELDNTEGIGSIAVPSKILIDTLKEFPEQPLSFNISEENFNINILSQNGKYSINGADSEEYPQISSMADSEATSFSIGHDALLSGIDKTLFATADDELRPVMNGILVELTGNEATFVASDAHKLVRYKRFDISSSIESSFILPKKPAALLRGLLPKEEFDVQVNFDKKNAQIVLTNYKMTCRLIDGKYPAYQSVIPTNNTNKMVIDRLELYNTLRRVSVFSNQASNLSRFKISENQLVVSAQDLDFSVSAVEKINCNYEGDDIEIGFKSSFLLEILSNINSTDVEFQLADPTRAGLMLPAEKEFEEEDLLMLLMPMMSNS